MEKKSIRLIGPWILALLLVGGLLFIPSIPVSAAQYHYGDYDYSTSTGPNPWDHTVATIEKYTGAGGAITIPSTLGGFQVATIGYSVFYYKSSLTSVVIPWSVITIGDWAFDHCTKLTSVTIGSGVRTIGDNAFSECTSLTSIIIPSSVITIGSTAFWGSPLTSITFLGLQAPSVGSNWIPQNGVLGHAYATSNFPHPGGSDFYGLTMGSVIPLPSAPVNVHATPGYGTVLVSWTAPNSNVFSPITGYNIYRSSNWSEAYSLIASSSGLNYTDNGLASSKTYYYKVSAVTAAGEGDKSIPTSAWVTQSPVLAIDSTTLISLVCGTVIALALIIGVILVKRSGRKK